VLLAGAIEVLYSPANLSILHFFDAIKCPELPHVITDIGHLGF